MRLLALFLSLFTSLFNFSESKEHEITCINQELNEVVETIDDYKVSFSKEVVNIYFEDKIIYTIDNYSFKYIFSNNKLYLFYKESFYDSLKIICFNKDKININYDLNNSLYAEFDVINVNNTFYVASSINEYTNDLIIKEYKKRKLEKVNCVLLKYDLSLNLVDVKIYGGLLNDYFDKIYYKNYKIYLTGYKDTLSGGTFGNGGGSSKGYFLTTLDYLLDVEKYVIFDSLIQSIDAVSDGIYVFLDNYIYLLDSALNVKSSLEIGSGCVFGKIMNNSTPVIITENKLIMYDYISSKIISEYNFSFNEDFLNYFIIKDCIYFETQYFYMRLLIFDKGIVNNIFSYDDGEKLDDNFAVQGLFKEYPTQGIIDNDFDPSIFGIYLITSNYGEFDLDLQIEVKERENVTNGKIYPTGYNLIFSGIGYLNGNEITNNYMINESGDYSLRLVGKDKEKTINFSVRDMDISFNEESLKKWDFELYPNIERELLLDVNISEDFTIKDIIINDESYPFKFVNNQIILKFKEYNKGLYNYEINKIIFENKNTLENYSKDINKTLTLKVLNEKISLDNNVYKENDQIIYNIKINNNKENIRYLKLETKNNKEEVNYISLTSNDIILNFEGDNEKEISLYIVYDIGNMYYEEEYLFSFNYELNKNNNFGSIDLDISENEVNEITLKINDNKYLKSINVDNEIIYKYEGNTIFKSIIYGFIIFIILLTIYITIIKLKRKRN